MNDPARELFIKEAKVLFEQIKSVKTLVTLHCKIISTQEAEAAKISGSANKLAEEISSTKVSLMIIRDDINRLDNVIQGLLRKIDLDKEYKEEGGGLKKFALENES